MISEQFIQEHNQKLIMQGEAKGEARGEAKGLREAIEALCEVLNIPLTADRQTQLGQLDVQGLHAKLVQLRQNRAW